MGLSYVHVPKADGSVRVCGDYKAVNQVIEGDGYKLPNISEMFAKITQNGMKPKVYSVIDLSGAFNQLFLDEKSAELLTLNTIKGLMGTKRLCYGVKTAPAQFQAAMDKILAGIEGVYCYIDDILIVSNTKEEHLNILKLVFERFRRYNVKLNGTKCKFFQKDVQYLGHQICAEGIRPLQNKVEAIQGAPQPRDVSELKSFLGMINFYGKFIPNLSEQLHPLHGLLHHNAPWLWSSECDQAFKRAKEMLVGNNLLVHYDHSKPLVLCVDASSYGLGAVLSHKYPNGSEKPIAYASRTLNIAEKKYAQIEKEGLAIIFGIKKFHLYLYGNQFTLVTDHQPLTRIFGPKNGIPPLAAARMQRWALILAGYQHNITYRSSRDNAVADLLSRLPMPVENSTEMEEVNYICHTGVDNLPVTSKRIAQCTSRDPLLCKVYELTTSGWPSYIDNEELKPYWIRRDELSIEDGCLLWGRRVIIPCDLQKYILTELHECHPGMCRMKALARSFVWWPGLDQDIEDTVRACQVCVTNQESPKVVPLLLWPWPTEPWQRIHVDFAEIKGLHFLLIVDSHSKWLEVFPMTLTNAYATINVLKGLFARYGLPHELVSDNGPQFASNEFKCFLRGLDIKHTLCPPYHPASNGLAEKHVQTFKKMFTRYEGTQQLALKMANILSRYRNIPHSTTGKTPAELFLKRSPRTVLSLIKPCLQKRVEKTQASTKFHRDGSHPKHRSFDKFQRVKVRNIRGGKEKWISGVIIEVRGPLTYLVRVPGNNRRFVHADHLIPDDSVSPELQDKESLIYGKTTNESSSQKWDIPVNISGGPLPQFEPSEETFVDDTPNLNVSGDSVSVPKTLSSPVKVSDSPTPLTSPGTGRTSRFGRVIRTPHKLNLYLK